MQEDFRRSEELDKLSSYDKELQMLKNKHAAKLAELRKQQAELNEVKRSDTTKQGWADLDSAKKLLAEKLAKETAEKEKQLARQLALDQVNAIADVNKRAFEKEKLDANFALADQLD